MDNLAVVVPSFGFVLEKLAELTQESLPVAGDILHLQVVEDEPLPPVWYGEKARIRHLGSSFSTVLNGIHSWGKNRANHECSVSCHQN